MIGFRVDANENIATGHLMRCIAIAEGCRKMGQQCMFFLAEDKETSRLAVRQFPYRILHTRWDSLEEEIPVLCQAMEDEPLDWLVVDSYQATAGYLKELNENVPVMYIDDMALEHYQVSALLHYGIYPDLEEYRREYDGTGVKILAGLEYIPLREEFSGGGGSREQSILITTGGTDPYNISGKLLGLCLAHPAFSGYRYHVIVGSMNENESELQNMALEYSQICLHKNVTNMGDYMRRCRLAVSAGGTTLYELCACGTPTVCFSFADNQREGTYQMGQRGIMQYAGDAREIDVAGRIVEKLLPLLQNQELCREYAARMRRLVDGRGVERIAAVLCPPV